MTSPFASKPVLTYFNLPNIGRGEVVRLFFAEAQIEYDDIRVPYGEWAAHKGDVAKLNPYGALPVLQLGDKILTQHVPILRYLSKKLGKYGGSNDDEAFAIDQITDVYIDWRASWVTTLGGDKTAHAEKIPRFYAAFEGFLAQSGKGPFLLGDQVSYAEPCVYQAVHNDGNLNNTELAAKFPQLYALVKAFGARPQVAKYLEERKKNEQN
ncbi:glutathione S-transferase [Rhizoclosmatium globosum]|uniref:Glutathione S-transferase n=1 Tax=Rhizoclosmatium globosum TaxID=329046 RepID=A0A1Y2CQD2_9FUNG|nr:glutathione S-transferase [Rhizoclosmatium globosum]|eukprot:ORY49044.1 glutathione S-transferase [Rhizoclosmatium globosum]